MIDVASLAGVLTPKHPATVRAKRGIDAARVKDLLKKIHERETESLNLMHPLPYLEPFHECRKKVRILDGSNQSGKSAHAALEVGRAITGCDPYHKYPERHGAAIFVGLDQDHLADPMYKKLFKEGEFKLIRDEHTGKWRSVRPDPNNPFVLDPYDEAYIEKWKDAPPLIPPRMIRTQSMDDKAKEVPRVTILTNGWRILWRSSGGNPPQGVQSNLIWADEELASSTLWLNEIVPRLIKKGGYFIWSATPQQGGPELFELREKADNGSEYVARFTMLIDHNPYMREAERKAFKELLTNDDEVRVRYYGEYALMSRRVYPTYNPHGMHGCDPFDIPEDWARYVVVDPGRQHCGTIFAAVDPEERHVWIYDGLDIQSSDAQRWAGEVAKRQGSNQFEAFVIDQQMGKQHPPGHGHNVAYHYWQALEEAGIEPRQKGPLEGFFPGTNDISAREEALLGMMSVRSAGLYAGTPKLQVFRGRIPQLDRQIKLAQTDVKNPGKRAKQQEDLLVTLEYLAGFDPRYQEPEPARETPSRDVFGAFQKKRLNGRRRDAVGIDL